MFPYSALWVKPSFAELLWGFFFFFSEGMLKYPYPLSWLDKKCLHCITKSSWKWKSWSQLINILKSKQQGSLEKAIHYICHNHKTFSQNDFFFLLRFVKWSLLHHINVSYFHCLLCINLLSLHPTLMIEENYVWLPIMIRENYTYMASERNVTQFEVSGTLLLFLFHQLPLKATNQRLMAHNVWTITHDYNYCCSSVSAYSQKNKLFLIHIILPCF